MRAGSGWIDIEDSEILTLLFDTEVATNTAKMVPTVHFNIALLSVGRYLLYI